jgi:hypothetical protein
MRGRIFDKPGANGCGGAYSGECDDSDEPSSELHSDSFERSEE